MGRSARPFPSDAAGDSPTRGYAGPPGDGYRNSLRSEPVAEGHGLDFAGSVYPSLRLRPHGPEAADRLGHQSLGCRGDARRRGPDAGRSSGTTAADSSGNAPDAILGAGAAWTTGQVGEHVLHLDGTGNGNADIPAPVVDTSRSFTVSAWVKLDSADGYQTAVSIDGDQLSGFYLQLSGSTGAFSFTRRAADSTSAAEARADSPVRPTAGTWYHLVGVDDATTGNPILSLG
ncbi:LamG-like jellyroll fold domain-containing protein [Streptomyces sp. NPDC017086]|uniref:LamG-like jellyroll fold domain-containing protein n=1 Tax=Streptomyces sp. NPDC017086 TaxID=3364976 RepID=UPI0037A5ACCC